MKITAVIGANFGDEGKGLLTDYLCAGHPRSLVIRFNGGAQAGHTVVTPEGRRHVFHHFGSGTLAGADTYLSQFFIVNPLLWWDEFKELGEETQRVFAHPDALLTTPYDMLFNQALETNRGSNRHGSCGIGINETVRRGEGPYRTTLRNLFNRGFGYRLGEVKNYFEERAKEFDLDITSIPAWNSVRLRMDYMDRCAEFEKRTIVLGLDSQIMGGWKNIVFEGAQGLLLDQDHSYAPFVTSTKTGVDNVKILCEEMGLEKDIELIYVSRSYLTRHGPGPFPTEVKGAIFKDTTNVKNEWQGSLRFGILDIYHLRARILDDASKMNSKPSLAVTCIDQLHTPNLAIYKFPDFRNLYYSMGPTRDHVKRTKL